MKKVPRVYTCSMETVCLYLSAHVAFPGNHVNNITFNIRNKYMYKISQEPYANPLFMYIICQVSLKTPRLSVFSTLCGWIGQEENLKFKNRLV